MMNPEYAKEFNKKAMDHFFENREKRVAYNKNYAKQNRERLRPWFAKYNRDRRAMDPQFVMQNRLRSRLGQAIRIGRGKKKHKTYDLVGCSIESVCAHIEAQFKDGMTWDNRNLWEIDHIKPCDSFDLRDEAQQRACFHFTNLQPLWKRDNREKGCKLI